MKPLTAKVSISVLIEAVGILIFLILPAAADAE